MTTEQGFSFFERPEKIEHAEQTYNDLSVMSRYPDMAYISTAYGSPEQHPADELMAKDLDLPAPAPREPRRPRWSYYANNPLFAPMTEDVVAQREQESTPFYDMLDARAASERLIDRIDSQAAEATPATQPALEAHEQPYTPPAPQSGTARLMSQGARMARTTAPAPKRVVHAADLPVTTIPYGTPVPLKDAPRLAHTQSVGLETDFMRGPLPDSITPRLKVRQPAEAVVSTPIYDAMVAAHAHETIPVAVEAPQPLQALPTPDKNAGEALLARLSRQAAETATGNETTQVISTSELAQTVKKEQTVSAAAQLVGRVTAEATTSTLEHSPKTIRSYGRELLRAAGFHFRMKRSESGFVGEIVDDEGTVHVDQINLDKNAEGERMRTTRRLIGRMARLGMRIPQLPQPRIA